MDAVFDGTGFQVRLESNGAIEVSIGDDVYLVESSYSYPGERIGHNRLARTPTGEASWQPEMHHLRDNGAEIRAAGEFYAIRRATGVRAHSATVRDTLTSIGVHLYDQPVHFK